jgi:hypothetical protein
MAIGGVEIPVSLSSFQEISMIENVSVKVPTLKFVYSDPINALVKYPLVDGTKIDIVLHSDNPNDPEPPIQYTFRASGAAYEPQGNRIFVRCTGVFDRMEYLRKMQKMPEQGNSSDAIKSVLSKNGFGKFDIDSTKDKMWWRPTGQMQFVSGFVKHIAGHGYVDSKSVMSHGVSLDGTFHYKNVAELAKSNGGRTITEVERVDASNGDIPLLEWKVKSLGGVTNMFSGYGSNIVQEKLDGSAEKISEMAMPLMGGALNMDSSLKGLIGSVVNIYAPTDIGNTHKMMINAQDQNHRGLFQLQSTQITCTSNQASGLKIYDKVIFKPHLPITNEMFDLVVGSYIVTSKTKYFKRGFYRELYTLSGSGLGNENSQVGYSA